MTVEEKAEEYTNNRDCYVYDIEGNGIDITGNLRQSYLDGYITGLAEGRKETFALYNTEVDDIAKDYANRLKKFEKELEKENAELKEKLKGFESGDVCWRGDMDATIKQNLELKEELAEMKEKHESNKRSLKLIIEKGVELEKEKCELLGIIQGKDEVIKGLKAHCKAVDEVNEKMKCCENCIHHFFMGDDLQCKLPSYDEEFLWNKF